MLVVCDLRAKIRTEPHSLYRCSHIHQDSIHNFGSNIMRNYEFTQSHTHTRTQRHWYARIHTPLIIRIDTMRRCNRLSDVCVSWVFYLIGETQALFYVLLMRLWECAMSFTLIFGESFENDFCYYAKSWDTHTHQIHHASTRLSLLISAQNQHRSSLSIRSDSCSYIGSFLFVNYSVCCKWTFSADVCANVSLWAKNHGYQPNDMIFD